MLAVPRRQRKAVLTVVVVRPPPQRGPAPVAATWPAAKLSSRKCSANAYRQAPPAPPPRGFRRHQPLRDGTRPVQRPQVVPGVGCQRFTSTFGLRASRSRPRDPIDVGPRQQEVRVVRARARHVLRVGGSSARSELRTAFVRSLCCAAAASCAFNRAPPAPPPTPTVESAPCPASPAPSRSGLPTPPSTPRNRHNPSAPDRIPAHTTAARIRSGPLSRAPAGAPAWPHPASRSPGPQCHGVPETPMPMLEHLQRHQQQNQRGSCNTSQ